MAGLVSTIHLPNLTPVIADGEGSEGDPRPLFTLEATSGPASRLIRSYTPTDGGSPRLVARLYKFASDPCLHVWDSGTGVCLRALEGLDPVHEFTEVMTYQRPSDGRPRIAAGSNRGRLCIWDGEDFQLLHRIWTSTRRVPVRHLAVYEAPMTGTIRLVTG
jgi:WD40 repeat protein